MLRNVNRVGQAILDVTVQRGHKTIPQPALGKNQKAQTVDLVHGLHDPGEECLGDAMAVVAPAGEEQVFELVESYDNGNLETPEDRHQRLEQAQHQLLPARTNVEIQLGKPVREKVRQISLITEQDGSGESLLQVAAHQACRVMASGVLDVIANDLACPLWFQPRFL